MTSSVAIVPAEGVRLDNNFETRIRLTDDPDVPAHRLADPNLTHPFRQKEVVELVNAKLIGRSTISTHHVLSVRKVHNTDQKPQFYYRGNYSSPTYSQQFVDWLLNQFRSDDQLFEKAKAAYKAQGSSAKV